MEPAGAGFLRLQAVAVEGGEEGSAPGIGSAPAAGMTASQASRSATGDWFYASVRGPSGE